MADMPLHLLLIEDRETDRNAFLDFCDMTDDMEIVGTASGCSDGLPLVSSLHPDILILDLELADGSGLDILYELEKLPLIERPYVVVTTVVLSECTLAVAREHGSQYEFIKTHPGYGPNQVIEYLRRIRKYLHKQPYIGPYVRLESHPSALSPNERIRRLRKMISYDIQHLGITPQLRGARPLKEALLMLALDNSYTIEDMTKINKRLVRKIGKPISNITKNMDTAIKHAWNVSTPDTIQMYYPSAFNPSRGNPTIAEFLFTMAERYRDVESIDLDPEATV